MIYVKPAGVHTSILMMNKGQINFNCGDTPDKFNEKKFLENYFKVF